MWRCFRDWSLRRIYIFSNYSDDKKEVCDVSYDAQRPARQHTNQIPLRTAVYVNFSPFFLSQCRTDKNLNRNWNGIYYKPLKPNDCVCMCVWPWGRFHYEIVSSASVIMLANDRGHLNIILYLYNLPVNQPVDHRITHQTLLGQGTRLLLWSTCSLGWHSLLRLMMSSTTQAPDSWLSFAIHMVHRSAWSSTISNWCTSNWAIWSN